MLLYFYKVCFAHISVWRGPILLAREFMGVGTPKMALPFMQSKSKRKLPWPWAVPIESRRNMRFNLSKPVSDKKCGVGAIATHAGWIPGCDVIVPPPKTAAALSKRSIHPVRRQQPRLESDWKVSKPSPFQVALPNSADSGTTVCMASTQAPSCASATIRAAMGQLA